MLAVKYKNMVAMVLNQLLEEGVFTCQQDVLGRILEVFHLEIHS